MKGAYTVIYGYISKDAHLQHIDPVGLWSLQRRQPLEWQQLRDLQQRHLLLPAVRVCGRPNSFNNGIYGKARGFGNGVSFSPLQQT